MFFFKVGGLAVKRDEVDAIVRDAYTTPSHYMKYWLLRRATEHECRCQLYLKFGFCRHMFAVKIQLHGYRDVCPPIMQDHGPLDAAYDSEDDDDDEEAEGEAGEDDEADLPDAVTTRTKPSRRYRHSARGV